jgi:SAM-dependent methyltransferase
LIVHNYERTDLMVKLKDALEKAGLANGFISHQQLAQLDQFHSRGLRATIELAATLDIAADTRVLDVGSGLGGPARYLAGTFGCQVVGVDVTASYVDAAKYLTARTGLSNKVSFECGNALALPFSDSSFDLVWTQHVAMNIENRELFYSEIARVLKQGGRFAVYDVVAGTGGPVHFPVPWSSVPDTSFLLTAEAMQKVILESGFTTLSWSDRTADGTIWFSELIAMVNSQTYVPPPLSLNLAVGSDFPMRASNLGRSLKENRARLIEAVFERAK